MKKCPVCGVMMGDNVARCSMCKYDFQKAAREGEDAARQEFGEILRQGFQSEDLYMINIIQKGIVGDDPRLSAVLS